jgi:hypothetical protein
VFDKDLYEVCICYDPMLGVASEHECKVHIFILFFIFRFDARRDDLVNEAVYFAAHTVRAVLSAHTLLLS